MPVGIFFKSNGRYIDYLSFTCATSKSKNIKSYTINTTFKKRGNIKNINTLKPLKINKKVLMIRSSHEVVTMRKVSIPSLNKVLCATYSNHLYSIELLMMGIIVSETC